MRHTTLFALALALLIFSCSKDQNDNQLSLEQSEPLSKSEINHHIQTSLEKNGIFNWNSVDDHFLWSAAMQSDSIFSIGYQPVGFENLDDLIHEVDIKSSEWTEAQQTVLDLILEGEKAVKPDATQASILPFGLPQVIPSMAVIITNPETVARLRQMEEVRYLESMGYTLPSMSLSGRSSSGCSGSPSYNLNSADYTTISPNVKQSWHHASSDISGAWNTSTGDNVTICIIDSGASFDQENLGSAFNSGQSSGRTVQKYATHFEWKWSWSSWSYYKVYDSPDDPCGHGTSMCGLATAPRGNDGNAVGVAYNSDLISIRAVEDVIINTSEEKEAVKDALVIAGNRNDVRVISMSIGSPFSSGTVEDGINYAYNRGKFIAAAAGTSLSWTSWVGVIFPANLSRTVAITGVKDTNPLVKCNTCHEGSAVDFVMRMERNSNEDRTALSLALDTNQPKYIGGSSAATASVAGIAALIFSEHPSASRADVFNAMKENASYYPNEDSDLGWGIIDAEAAVNENL